jgi:hypothetical protein
MIKVFTAVGPDGVTRVGIGLPTGDGHQFLATEYVTPDGAQRLAARLLDAAGKNPRMELEATIADLDRQIDELEPGSPVYARLMGARDVFFHALGTIAVYEQESRDDPPSS